MGQFIMNNNLNKLIVNFGANSGQKLASGLGV